MLRNKELALIFIVLFVFFGYGFHEILSADFYGIHSWRQADSLSLTYNYYLGNGFLEPEISNLISDNGTSGKSAGEFPILYWLIAKVWQITGVSESTYRIIVFLLMLTGFSAQYLALKEFFKARFVPFTITAITFSSPVLLSYGTSFITNMPSLSLVQIGASLIYLGYKKDKLKYTHIGVISFALAGLLKVTALASFIIILPLISVYYFKKNKYFFISLFAALIVVVWWYGIYVPAYTDIHHGKYTFNDLWPIWEMSDEQIAKAVKFFKEITFFQVMSPVLWFVFGACIIVSFLIKGRTGLFFKYATLGLVAGFALYFMLWFNAVHHHDYYFINSLIVLIFVLIGGAYFVKDRFSDFYHSKKFKYILGTLTVFSIIYGMNTLRMRHQDINGYWRGFAIAFNHKIEPGYWNWMAEHSNSKKVRGIDVWLDKAGVSREAKIACISDPSFCIELFCAKRKGFSNFNFQNSKEKLDEAISKGVEAIVVSNHADTVHYPGRLGEEIGRFNDVLVYRPKKQ